MKTKTVLISGAGVAGLSVAYWLKRFGFVPTLIEKHPCLRTGGYKIDLRGAGLEVLKRMGVYPAISESRTKNTRGVLLDETGRQIMEMSVDLLGTRLEGVDLEIMRSTLCHILKDAVKEEECIFGDSITRISDRNDSVHVEFEKHPSRTFDLVIGADGLHSKVRKLVFGEESNFSQDLGIYVSVWGFPNFLNLNDCEIEQHTLQKFVNLYRDRKSTQATAAIAFSTPKLCHSRDPKDLQQYIAEVFAGSKWENFPKILAGLANSPDFYFDSMAQIHMPYWHKGRVALVGDAAYSATPLSGQGTSIAIAGAYVLAGELFEAHGDSAIAFSQYEALMRPFIKKNQELAAMSLRIMKGSAYSKWVHRIGALMPAKLVDFFKKRALKQTTKAANALRLKDYEKNR
ncbi:MAG: FAD-dependent monooxygenase [Parachlamydiales bacterium]|nr:FAD-dependent monooxygenase [Parachlamydiales bacterium]